MTNMIPRALTVLAFVGLTLAACGDDNPIKHIDRSTDCDNICKKYHDCLNDNTDVDDCSNRCTDMSSDKEDEQIDKCNDCVNDKSCTNRTFDRTRECARIIAGST